MCPSFLFSCEFIKNTFIEIYKMVNIYSKAVNLSSSIVLLKMSLHNSNMKASLSFTRCHCVTVQKSV